MPSFEPREKGGGGGGGRTWAGFIFLTLSLNFAPPLIVIDEKTMGGGVEYAFGLNLLSLGFAPPLS